MKFISFLITLLLTSSFFSQVTLDKTMVSGGITRSYKLYIPASYSSSTPVALVINMHGRGSTSAQQLLYGDFRSIADTANFIMVLPQGTVHPTWSSTFWNAYFGQSVNDINFISELIDTISSNYSIDPDRVHATGMSNGGYMSFALAAGLSNKIASLASVTGTMTLIFPASLASTNPVSMMQIHGTADSTVKYNGDASSKSVSSVINYWNTHNNTNTTPIIDSIPNTNLTDNCTAIKYTYGGGTANSEVIHYKIVGGGHTWPGAAISIGVTNRDFNASEVIWQFFNKHPRANSTGIKKVSPSFNFEVTQNFNNRILFINGLESTYNYRYDIFNLDGKKVVSGKLSTYNNRVLLEEMKTGIYVISIKDLNTGEMRSKKFILR